MLVPASTSTWRVRVKKETVSWSRWSKSPDCFGTFTLLMIKVLSISRNCCFHWLKLSHNQIKTRGYCVSSHIRIRFHFATSRWRLSRDTCNLSSETPTEQLGGIYNRYPVLQRVAICVGSQRGPKWKNAVSIHSLTQYKSIDDVLVFARQGIPARLRNLIVWKWRIAIRRAMISIAA